MCKKLSGCMLLIMFLAIAGCDNTKIETNPAPIVWGEISFAPATIERSGSQTVWNNVAFSGYGQTGTIGKVTIRSDETIVENMETSFYSAKRQVWKNVTGDYRKALEYFMSGKYDDAYNSHDLTSLPKFKVGSYEAFDEKWINSDGVATDESMRMSDFSFFGLSGWEITALKIKTQDQPEIAIASASASKILIPEKLAEKLEETVIDNLVFNNIEVPQENIRIGKIYIDYQDAKLKAGVEKIAIPGEALDELGITNAPQMIEGSLMGQGQLLGDRLQADASLNLTGLLEMSADLAGLVRTATPENISFSITDTGVLKYLSDMQKTQLAMLAMLVPNSQEAIMGFLSKPGQTLAGSISFASGLPHFSFSLK